MWTPYTQQVHVSRRRVRRLLRWLFGNLALTLVMLGLCVNASLPVLFVINDEGYNHQPVSFGELTLKAPEGLKFGEMIHINIQADASSGRETIVNIWLNEDKLQEHIISAEDLKKGLATALYPSSPGLHQVRVELIDPLTMQKASKVQGVFVLP